MKLPLCAVILVCAFSTPSQTLPTLSDFPAPTKVLQDEKQFNAVKLGPGNTFSIQKTPPDFQLDSFDFSPDGEWTFMRWDSGRVEVRNNSSGKRVAQFKFMPGVVFEDYHDETNQLAVTWQQGLIRLVDPHSGKCTREIHFEIGKHNYAVQKVILAKNRTWIAYLNEENGKVLDLRSEPPRVLADLEDANDLALTPDESELWLISRQKIFGLACMRQMAHSAVNGSSFNIRASKSVKTEGGSGASCSERFNCGRSTPLWVPAGSQNRRSKGTGIPQAKAYVGNYVASKVIPCIFQAGGPAARTPQKKSSWMATVP